MTSAWSEIAWKEAKFRGLPLSEIARMALSDYIILTDAERAVATRALAVAYLNLLGKPQPAQAAA